jgi:protein-tyrosine-phosphatase
VKQMARARTEGPYKVLVLDGHTKAAAETVLALPRACEIHVAAVDRDCVVFASRRVAQRLDQPEDLVELRRWLEIRDAAYHYHLIICCSEVSLMAVKAQDLDALLRAKLVIASQASIDVALDKERTLTVAARLGIPTPATTRIARRGDALPATFLPAVIKPLHNTILVQGRVRHLSVRICATLEERELALDDLLLHTPVLEQGYFVGRAIGVEALFDRGRLCWLFGHERLHEIPLTGGTSTYRRSIEIPAALHEATVRLLTHLNWHGVAMVEFKLDLDQRFCLIDINPRLWASLPLASAAGMNFPAGLLDIALGRSLPFLPDYRIGHYMRDVPGDVLWISRSWQARREPLVLKRLSLGDALGWLRPLLGQEGWDLFRWRESELWRAVMRRSLARLQAHRSMRKQVSDALEGSLANWRGLRESWRDGAIGRVLVLCTGNICRSPVVERLLAKSLPALEVRSAGLRATAARQCPPDWSDLVGEVLGLDMESHRSVPVDSEMLEWAQLVIVMDAKNWTALTALAKAPPKNAVLLGVAAGDDAAETEVIDPVDLEDLPMRSVARHLGELVGLLTAQARTPAPAWPIGHAAQVAGVSL